MLTYPSDSLPQIVCPMDEDAIPPIPFCSAPPHSEPPPPLLPLSSTTPSCANDGISGNRRGGRIQGVRTQTLKKQTNSDSGETHKPSKHNPSSTKRQREGGSMVQASQSKQLRVGSRNSQKQYEEGVNFSNTTECKNSQKDQKSPDENTNVPASENVVEQFADNTTQYCTDATKSDMDTCSGLAVGHTVENVSTPKGWVMGPLFQSFKSKMASFTEIVMSPVKLFRANSPPPLLDHQEKLDAGDRHAEEISDVEHKEPSTTLDTEGQSKMENEEFQDNQQTLSSVANGQNTETCDVRYCKKFDAELSTHSPKKVETFAVTVRKNDLHDCEPLQHDPLPFVSENITECVRYDFRSSKMLQEEEEDQTNEQAAQVKPVLRKCTRNTSEVKKFASKNLTSKFKREESDPDVSVEPLSHRNSDRLKRTDINTDKTVPILSSDCCTQLDCLQTDCANNGMKMESCLAVLQSHRDHLNDSANGNTLKTNIDTRQLEYSGPGRAKSGIKSRCQVLVKRKKLARNIYTDDAGKHELLNMTSDRRPRSPRRRKVSPNTVVDMEETLKTARKSKALPTRANKKERDGHKMFPMVDETILNVNSKSSPDTVFVCSLDEVNAVSENSQTFCSSKINTSGLCKSLGTRAGGSKLYESIDNSMDLETTVAISSTNQAEPLTEVLVRPDIKQHRGTSKRTNINKKPLKRKSPIQARSATESDKTLVSTASILSMDSSELTPTNFNTALPIQREGNQSSKRSRRGFRGAGQSSESVEAQETRQRLMTKESQFEDGKAKNTTDPVYFEMTPFESNHQPVPSPSRPLPSCVVLLKNDVRHVIDLKEKSPAFVVDGVFTSDTSVSRLRSSARRVNIKSRRADNQSRKSRVLHSRTGKVEEMTNSVTMEDADLVTAAKRSSGNGFSNRLLRSYSCPEIPSFCSNEPSWTPHHSRTPTSHQHQPPHTPHVHKSFHRARRHTVCSVEVEREIAPLCLRKEVYPSRRSAPYDCVTHYLSPSIALSPSTTLSALASCFLSSPLAFLSKKADSRGSAASPSTSSHVSPTSSSTSAFTWHLPGFLQTTDSSHATSDSSSSKTPLKCETESGGRCEDDDGEDTSSSSQEYDDVGLREETALSDSEIKVVQKHEERGKVSSIRIRKTLPKPQNNLTPMGLPKPIRLKKKQFSLEEIYTNKNFSKPPESRLETIFEVPFNRRNGSESWFGQRRVKRFLEFLEAGETRKPKKPLVGVGKTGVSSSRTRRGGFAKDEPSLTVQDVDSLLCAKLDELNLWLIHDQNSS